VYNFGKFSVFIEDIVADDILYKDVNFYRNGTGQDLVVVLKANPHAFYIAVDEMGKIVSMESDPEAIQLANMDIIGIDSDFGFTRDEGGTVYGAIWDGVQIVAPPVPTPILTARQFWLAALELDITEAGLLAAIADETSPLYIEDKQERAATVIDIAKAQYFRRDYPLVDDMAAAFGLSTVEMDALWSWAAQIE